MDREYWELLPAVRINKLDFGGDRAAIRAILGEPNRSFRKSPATDSITDVYPSYHVYYSKAEKLEAIEFFGNDIAIGINSQQLFPGTLEKAKLLLPDLVELCGSYVSKSKSIGFSVENGVIVSMLAGCKGYYA